MTQSADTTPAPRTDLLGLVTGAFAAQAVYVAAELDLAGLLAETPRTAAELAKLAGAETDGVYRVLRVLAGFGLFTARPDGAFELTAEGRRLCDGEPDSLRGLARLVGHPICWEDWGHLADAVRTGEPVLPKLRGMGGYEFLAANPEYAGIFEGGMGDLSRPETDPIVAAYDFSGFHTIVDVFGGRGNLLAAVLQRAPGARGVLADPRAEMLGAAAMFDEAGLSSRFRAVPAGPFDPLPQGGDLYMMKHLVHEWPQDQSLQLLRNLRATVDEHARVLLMEYVVPKDAWLHLSTIIDLWLMILMGGKERTEAEYAQLLGQAGFRLERVVPTGAPVSIIEARPL